MSLIVVDVESDGPILGRNSMVCFGAVILDEKLDKTFYGKTAPISKEYNEESLSVSGFNRIEHESFQDPSITMKQFDEWLKLNSKSKPVLISDNPGYDASWINWYFYTYLGRNPFGWTSRRIGDLFCGFYKDSYYAWKKHRKGAGVTHDHNPLNDALTNAHALLYLKSQGLKL